MNQKTPSPMGQKKVSVIVPMYNAANTIEECLDSLTAQTIFTDMEFLLVDDCSTDDTISRVSKYEKKYPENIMLITLDQNGGPGRARNIAMGYACGEYVGFVDSDDAVVPTMYEHLYNEAKEKDADVVDGGILNKATDEAIVYTADDLTGIPDDHKRSILITSGGYICSKIFRREFLLQNNITFREEYVLEDMDYILEVFCKMKSISSVKEIMYIYRDTGASLSKTAQVDKYLHSTMTAMEAIYEKLSPLPFYEGIREAVEYAIIQLYSFSVNINLKALSDGIKTRKEGEQTRRDLKKLKNKLVRGGYDNKFVRDKISKTDIMLMKENDMI